MSGAGAAQRPRGLTIGLLCQGWWPQPGGVEAHTRALARGLAARGHRVTALCLDREGERAPYEVAVQPVEGVEVWRMRAAEGHRALADLVADAPAERVLRRWLDQTRCELVHVHHLSGFGVGALEAIDAAGLPTLLTLHDHWLACPCGQLLHDPADSAARLACVRAHWPHLLPSGGGAARGPRGEALADDVQADQARLGFVRAALGRPRLVLAPAPAVLATLACLGIDAAPGRVVEHGLDAEALAEAVRVARTERPRPRGDLVRLGVLGSVLPGKGVAELLEAFLASDTERLALEVHGPLLGFHGDTRHLERVRELAARSARVTLHGAYAPTELGRVLARLDAVAAPSLWEEVYGLSVREARAAGLPVLVSDRGGLPAAVQGGAAGRVLPAGDLEAWAEALRELERADGPRRRWAEQPHALRDVASMLADHERCYREVLRAAS